MGVEPTTFITRQRSASDWTVRDGDRLLTLGTDSIWPGRGGGRLTVEMINQMIIELSILDRAAILTSASS